MSKNILIADDNADLRSIFARSFAHRKYNVRVAKDGVEAVSELEQEIPDVLVLDVNMPRMSGLDVLTHVRTQRRLKALKVILVTGNYIAAESPEAEMADIVLVKPVSTHELVRMAERLAGI
jgi:CheY-like chemotaxis protein